MKHEIIEKNTEVTLVIKEVIIDYNNSIQLKKLFSKLFELDKKNIFLDLSQVEFIESNGIGMIAYYHKQYKDVGINFTIKSINAELKEIFKLFSFENLITHS